MTSPLAAMLSRLPIATVEQIARAEQAKANELQRRHGYDERGTPGRRQAAGHQRAADAARKELRRRRQK